MKTGNPNGEGLEQWNAWTETDSQALGMAYIYSGIIKN